MKRKQGRMRYKIYKKDLNTDYWRYHQDLVKSFDQTFIQRLLGKNKTPNIEDYQHPTTELVAIVDDEDEARKQVWLAEPWMNQSGGRVWYEQID